MVVHRFAWDFQVKEFLGFLSRNGRRQGYFVACVEPLPPLRKKKEKGRFFSESRGAAVQYYGSPVKIAFRQV